MTYLLLKYIHVLGATVILGTGSGIAFFMLAAHRSGDVAFIARTASIVVVADFVFTATAVILQPITGYLLLLETGTPIAEGWVAMSLALYVIVGLFWLPVVWIQIQMRDLARVAATTDSLLPPRYHRLFRTWFWFGFPGFGSVLLIFWLMIAKPSITLGL